MHPRKPAIDGTAPWNEHDTTRSPVRCGQLVERSACSGGLKRSSAPLGTALTDLVTKRKLDAAMLDESSRTC